MKVYGLSQINQQVVDDFDKHSDILSLMKELVADSSKYKKLTEDAVKAIALVDEEKSRRNEAIDLIEQSKQIQKQIRQDSVDLDAKKSAIEKLHSDNLRIISDEKEKIIAEHRQKRKSLEDRESDLNSTQVNKENLHKERVAKLDAREQKILEDEVRLDSKLKQLTYLNSEISAFKAKMA